MYPYNYLYLLVFLEKSVTQQLFNKYSTFCTKKLAILDKKLA
jgi:hypothetical protein